MIGAVTLIFMEIDMTESIRQVLMRRDNLTKSEAQEQIDGAREQLQEYLAEGDMESAENICQEYFGLEPDYLLELL